MTAESKENRAPKGTSPNEVLDATSFLFGTNAGFIEGLYAQYLSDSTSVDGTWRAFFDALGREGSFALQLGRGPSWRRDAKLALENGELVSALTGDWGEAPKKAAVPPPALAPAVSGAALPPPAVTGSNAGRAGLHPRHSAGARLPRHRASGSQSRSAGA